MRKIFQILIITTMLFSMSFIASGANISDEEEKYDSFLKDLSGSRSAINLTIDGKIAEKPIKPGGEPTIIPLTIKCEIRAVPL